MISTTIKGLVNTSRIQDMIEDNQQGLEDTCMIKEHPSRA